MITFFTLILILVSQLAYGSSCTATEQCMSSLNLICSTTGNLCECPTSLSANRCDCTSTQYYSGSVSGCGKNAFIN